VKHTLTIAAALVALAGSAEAADRPHKWYRDRDITVIAAVLHSQLDTPDFMRTGIASFTIEPQDKDALGKLDPEDMQHDIVDVTMKPGFRSAPWVCDALHALYWGSAFWEIHFMSNDPRGNIKCTF
jgi:hypothetical protein